MDTLDNNQLRILVHYIIPITVIVVSYKFFKATFVHFCEIIYITMRPLVGPRVVIHVAVTIFSILPPWFASAAANVLSVLNTIMPHPKVVTHLMSDDLVIGMICIQQINMAYNNRNLPHIPYIV